MKRIFICGVLLVGLVFAASAQSNVSAQPPLTARQASIVPIAALAAKGDQARLSIALNSGLDSGLTINEIKEILTQLYAYAGFPRSLNAIGTFTAVVKARKEKGLSDPEGKLPEKISFNGSKYAYGKDIQARLTGASANSVQQFVPVIDSFLKEHLFADIFGRNNLDFQSRELATVSILASIGNADAQLRSHIGVARNTGLTQSQLISVANKLSAEVGKDEGNLTLRMIGLVFQSEKRSNPSLPD